MAISAISCSKPVVQEPEKSIELTKAEREISAKSKTFAFNLFAQAIENNTENIGLSPLSATYALSMAANGAAGETRQEIIDVLDFKNFTISDINEYNSKFSTCTITAKCLTIRRSHILLVFSILAMVHID